MTIQIDETKPTRPALLPLSEVSLFLDIDGTLAEFESTPEAVGPLPRRTALLRRLYERLDGRLAAVSGRGIDSIDHILEGVLPVVAGVIHRTPPHPALAEVRAEAEAFAATRPGVQVEDKGLAVTLHYRRAPDEAPHVRALASRLSKLGLDYERGNMVVELKTPGADKGYAVRAIMAEPPFSAGTPVFVGDDMTDENGFGHCKAMGGYGVLVGPLRITSARYRLENVEDVLGWLEASLEAGR
jgi:trehalose 6-phosphate phosphatase